MIIMTIEAEVNKLYSRLGILEERQSNTKENLNDFKDDIKDGFDKLDAKFEKLEELLLNNQIETRNKFDSLKKDIIQFKIEREGSFGSFYKKHPKLVWTIVIILLSANFSGTLSSTINTVSHLF